MPGDVFDVNQWYRNLATNLTAPIFQGGRLKSNVALAQARFKQAAAAYGQNRGHGRGRWLRRPWPGWKTPAGVTLFSPPGWRRPGLPLRSSRSAMRRVWAAYADYLDALRTRLECRVRPGRAGRDLALARLAVPPGPGRRLDRPEPSVRAAHGLRGTKQRRGERDESPTRLVAGRGHPARFGGGVAGFMVSPQARAGPQTAPFPHFPLRPRLRCWPARALFLCAEPGRCAPAPRLMSPRKSTARSSGWTRPFRAAGRVNQGQVLFRIDDTDYRNRVEQARANVAASKSNCSRPMKKPGSPAPKYAQFRRRQAEDAASTEGQPPDATGASA